MKNQSQATRCHCRSQQLVERRRPWRQQWFNSDRHLRHPYIVLISTSAKNNDSRIEGEESSRRQAKAAVERAPGSHLIVPWWIRKKTIIDATDAERMIREDDLWVSLGGLVKGPDRVWRCVRTVVVRFSSCFFFILSFTKRKKLI